MPIQVEGITMEYNRDTTIPIEPDSEETFIAIIELTDVRKELSNETFDFYVSMRKEGTPNPTFTYTYAVSNGVTAPVVSGENETEPTSFEILESVKLYCGDTEISLVSDEGSFEVEDGSILMFVKITTVQNSRYKMFLNVSQYSYDSENGPYIHIYDSTGKMVMGAYGSGNNITLDDPHIVNGR